MRVIILKSKRLSILVLIFIAFALVSFNSENDESFRRFWGSETSCVTSGGSSSCVTTVCTTTYYVFWLEASSTMSGFTIDCSHLLMDQGESDYQEE